MRLAIASEHRRANNSELVAQVCLGLQRMGHHASLEIQTDGEPALLELMEAVAAQRNGPPVLARSPAHDIQSNGIVERIVRSIEEMSRRFATILKRGLVVRSV